MRLRRRWLASLVVFSAMIAGCPGNGGGDAGLDGEVPVPDGGDGGPRDGGNPDGSMPPGPRVTICPGDSLPPLSGGAVCEATAGDGNTLITADVLTPGEVFRGGQVLVDATGTIACVGCDCSGTAGASTATRVVCPEGVLSPGLINAHEHLTFQGQPYTQTAERYEHRHDWRRGLRGHTRIGSMMATGIQTQWAELRMVMSGATSINGSNGQEGFLRNLDTADMEGLGQPDAHYDTFPLGDGSDPVLVAMGCDSYSAGRTTAAEIAGDPAYTPHVSEGIDAEARNEFTCMSSGAFDLVQGNSAFIHGIALLPTDIEQLATDGAMLVWSPRSNITLYGDTARVTEYDRLGVLIALGTDWVFTGSMNMLRELSCADELNAEYLGGHFSDEALWLMATRNGAVATATDDVIGTIAVGRVADLAIFDGSMHPDHRAVIDAEPADVALVLRGGVPLFGESAVVPLLRDGGACDELDVCGSMRRVCAMREVGQSLAALQAANASNYPLFFCGEPMNEPSCIPARDAMGSLPSPEVDGSLRYNGMITATDSDGDGLANDEDLCPTVFDAIRPLDMGEPADFDRDGVGDACDPCPLDADTTECATVDPNDRDRDMVPDTMDNCVGLPNMDQADADMDGIGDACDACPMAANPGGGACPANIYDVKDGTVALGTRVAVRGVVTALASNGVFIQVATTDAAYDGPDNSGLFVFVGGAPTVARGDAVTAEGTVADFFGEIQLSSGTVTRTGAGVVPDAVVVEPAEIATGGTRAAALEGVLVRVDTVAVTNPMPAPTGGEMAPTFEFEVDSGLRVDDLFFRLSPFPVMGESFASITGVLAFRRSASKLHPRDGDDVVAGSAILSSLGPALSYVRAPSGGFGETFPEALTARLSRASGSDTSITVASSCPAELAVTSPLVIPAGSSSGVVQVRALSALATPCTITATLGADMRTAQVRVLDAAEMPASVTLDPSEATIVVDGMADFTVTLDIPAPAGGTVVTLATTVGSVPPTVTVLADALSATFSLNAGSSAATGTLTATLGASSDTAAITVSDRGTGRVVINEVDYDQAGMDTAEFVELYNPGSTPVSLDGLALVLVNGATTMMEYRRVALSGTLAPDGYAVVTVPAVTLPAGVARFAFSGTTDMVQNGAPDAVALVDTATGMLVDAFSYEGAVGAAVITGIGSPVSLVEGSVLSAAVADSNTMAGSLCRQPNGRDTDDAATDWAFCDAPTPGAANPMMMSMM